MSVDENEVNVTFKIYPTRYKNNKGFYIGKYSIDLNSNNSPVGLLSEVDFYLNSLFKNIVNDMKPIDDKTKKEPNQVVPVIIENIKLQPGKYKKPLIPQKGGVKTRIHNKRRPKNKTIRRRRK